MMIPLQFEVSQLYLFYCILFYFLSLTSLHLSDIEQNEEISSRIFKRFGIFRYAQFDSILH